MSLTRDEDGSARAPGVNRAQVRALAAGEPRPTATLDLHRHTLATARLRLASFLAEARTGGHRAVLVITGRGRHSTGPDRLHEHVPVWLAGPLAGGLLAFTPAPPRLGGPGALILLLRRTPA